MTVRWGILGCGNIARKFAECLAGSVEGASLQAVGSRDHEKATRFALDFAVPEAHGGYEQLVCNANVDAVYVASPHSHHFEHAELCLRNNKHVLVEKPFTANSREAKALIELAREKNLFLMEAMWMRFLPLMQRLRELIAGGELGRIVSLEADFSFRGSDDPDGRLMSPHLAGGALLDVGIYPVSLAIMAFGEQPEHIEGEATLSNTGVDARNSIRLVFSGGREARLTSSIIAAGSQSAILRFESGEIEMPLFWKAETATLRFPGASSDSDSHAREDQLEMPFACNGFEYETQEAVRCIRQGATESPIMPLGETLSIMTLLDRLRLDWGVEYPNDRFELTASK